MKQLGVICMLYGSTNKRYKNNNMLKYIWEVKLNKNPVEYIKNRDRNFNLRMEEKLELYIFLKVNNLINKRN